MSLLLRLVVAALAAAALLGVTRAGGQSARPIVIGVTISKTGSAAGTASYVLQGYQRWVGDANRHGGLLGRKVQLLVEDDRSDPQAAAALYRKLIAQDRVDLVAGPYASAVSQTVIPVTDELRKVLVGQTAATDLFARSRYAVQGFTQGRRYLPAVADVAKARGYGTVALVANDAPGTVEICGGVRERVRAIGLTVVHDATYARATTAFAGVVSPLAGKSADVVVGCAFLADSISLVRELDRQGVKPKLLALSIGPTDPAFRAALGSLADGVIGSTTWWPSLKTKGNAAFVSSFEKTFRRTPPYHSAAAYAGLQVLAAAVRAAKSLDQAKIRAQLATMRRETVAGTFRLDAQGRQLGYRSYLMQWQSGRQVLIWPAAVAEAPPQLPSR